MNPSQIDALLDTKTYPEKTSSVRHLQTHISHLFLTDTHVYKIKKPVDFGFLDFTTLAKRCYFCHEELRLNRRLSPDIYLAVVELRDNGSGGLSFSGDGEVLEYAVVMKRLPDERMMARLLDNRQVTPEDVDQIASVVAKFHASAATNEHIAAFGTAEAIRANWLENMSQTERYWKRTISEESHRLIGHWALEQLETRRSLFEKRVSDGFVRECDGDLHSENICLDGQVHIFDCIEFNEKFRYSDTAADVAFLAMDLENHGCRELSERFVEKYISASGDTGLSAVLPLYLANRAFIRGKVESFRLDDPLIAPTEQAAAADRAKRFFRLAQGYAVRQQLPLTLFLTCGLTGCGKSVLSRELAFQLGICHHSSDQLRKQLAGIEQTSRGAAIYSRSWNQATYARLAELTELELAEGRSLVVDATFRRRSDRAVFLQLAGKYAARLVILLPECHAALVRQRLADREQAGNDSSDGTWEVYQQQVDGFEPPDPTEGYLIHLDMTQAPELVVEHLLVRLGVVPLNAVS